MSSETEFTKGEWSAFLPGQNWQFNASDDEVVIGMGTFLDNPNYYDTVHRVVIEGFDFDGGSLDEVIANANLIKTAPKLYAALEEIYIYYTCDGEGSPFEIDIKNLLAEARGEC